MAPCKGAAGVGKRIGAAGFEPTTSCSQSRRSSQAELRPVRVGECSSEFARAVVAYPIGEPQRSRAQPIQDESGNALPMLRNMKLIWALWYSACVGTCMQASDTRWE